MSWTIQDRFPTWGEAGESPPDGFFYTGGDQVNEKHLDYLWDNLDALRDDANAALTDIDSNSDGVVDEADALTSGGSLLGDLNAADGETLWDESENHIPQPRLENSTITIAGNTVSLGSTTGISLGDLSDVSASGEGSGGGFDADTVDGQDYDDIQSWVNNNADVPNADFADTAGFANSAGDADTVDGKEAAELIPPNTTQETAQTYSFQVFSRSWLSITTADGGSSSRTTSFNNPIPATKVSGSVKSAFDAAVQVEIIAYDENNNEIASSTSGESNENASTSVSFSQDMVYSIEVIGYNNDSDNQGLDLTMTADAPVLPVHDHSI